MHTNRLKATEDFMTRIGMRPIFADGQVSILELRGGTHMVLVADNDHTPGKADFDLMVEDISLTHNDFTNRGLNPTAIEEGGVHRSFKLTEPGGNTILINSTHVSDKPV
jgi:hypothetical protein